MTRREALKIFGITNEDFLKRPGIQDYIFRELVFKHHPDTGDGNVDSFNKILKAKEILDNYEKELCCGQ